MYTAKPRLTQSNGRWTATLMNIESKIKNASRIRGSLLSTDARHFIGASRKPGSHSIAADMRQKVDTSGIVRKFLTYSHCNNARLHKSF